jgi:hypothetical protein
MTVAELLGRISSRELTEWIAFAQLEPFGTEVDFLGHAITASTVANANRGKGAKNYKPADFMPTFKKKQQTVDEMLQFAQMMTISMGGQDLREANDADK